VATTHARLRVQAYDGSNNLLAQDDSDADFTIVPTGITLITMNGGDLVADGTIRDVTWTTTGVVDHLRVKLSTDSGTSFPTTLVESIGSSPFHWVVGALAPTTHARIRVEALDSGNAIHAFTTSAADFSIINASVALAAPRAGRSCSPAASSTSSGAPAAPSTIGASRSRPTAA